MSTRSRSPHYGRSAAVIGALSLSLLLGVASSAPAQTGAAEEPSSLDILMESTSEGNTVQAAQMLYHQGMRELKRAEKLAARAAEEQGEEKRVELLEESAEANEAAVGNFMQALTGRPEMIEAYVALGSAFRHLGKNQEALEIHAIALRRDPDSLDNFEGWARALLNLNMLGNATASYTKYVEEDSPRAPILMDAMKQWLVAMRADPGEFDPAHVQRMADWIAEQEHGG